MAKINPFFSVIIPTFNSAETIERAINSILNQNFTSFEILIMDGASNDETKELVKTFDEPSVHWHSKKDSGVYEAMNIGIQKANGKWLYFMGSDDYLYGTSVLEAVHQEISKKNVEVLYGDVHSNLLGGRYAGEYDSEMISRHNICHQAIFFKREIFQTTGLFDLKFKICADYDHNIKWFFNRSFSKAYLPLIIAHFEDGGLSHTGNDHEFEAVKNIKLLNHGFKDLPFNSIKRIYRMEKQKAIANGNLKNHVFFTSYYYLGLIRRKLRNWFN